MTPLDGGKNIPRLNVKVGNKTFSWLFDIGAAVTCMNKQSFETAFGCNGPLQISKAQNYIVASGDKMSLLGFLKMDLWAKGKIVTYAVSINNELNANIIGIDFFHIQKLMYGVHTKQVKFARFSNDSITTIEQTVLPAMA